MNEVDRPTQDPFAERLRSALEGEGPEIPRETMWEEIQRARGAAGHTEPPTPRIGRRPAFPRLLGYGLAAAAVLALAFGVAQFAPRAGSGAPDPEQPGAAQGPGLASPASNGAYARSAADHFRNAETLLALFRTEAADVAPETGPWARTLLGTTRLLMDSPAGADPQTAEALADLELVLAQLALMGPETVASERRWIEESLQDRQLMMKLRDAQLDADRFDTAMED